MSSVAWGLCNPILVPIILQPFVLTVFAGLCMHCRIEMDHEIALGLGRVILILVLMSLCSVLYQQDVAGLRDCTTIGWIVL